MPEFLTHRNDPSHPEAPSRTLSAPVQRPCLSCKGTDGFRDHLDSPFCGKCLDEQAAQRAQKHYVTQAEQTAQDQASNDRYGIDQGA